ncbi:GntR family transcriptional regulator [Kitasatospora sp. GAS1066B]|uniref:GntR family transcriptional regulator n=1 Tax=Kitasatospora sp. GAS1066B TaxID=3156271 RepID=UPI003514FD0A
MADPQRDPHAPTAPYRRALAVLVDEIRAGHYDTGRRRFLSEAQLCERFGIARETARRVVRELREMGLVYTEWGRGTTVVAPEERPTHEGS